MKIRQWMLAFGMLTITTLAFAYKVPPPGHKFCKNNPTINDGVCIYFDSGGVVECNKVWQTNRDCYDIGID